MIRKLDAHTLQSLWRELYPTSGGFLTYAALRCCVVVLQIMIGMPTPYNHYGARAFPTSGGFLTYAALR
ncbi:hypothetical protein MUCCIDRAFT_105207 [Mucor lusitanicus CBS 277.49]|uniref:Uncharacterized protein n=1 Tax=Mucor lusitanicus CBS 277.49 TaxID=747725 RepID=A0A168GXN2_MUCCL|nr:hypothetical protein MUCCIDRAFT_115656 [Mucor lusitanicus CBS 277.49]OAC98482.1 hypothetical protein MUCCIDRAFT_115397 [Mucor lusitanicus CBS 277.49]OAD00427.1 hypothetical protein MUCCIDRAFT_113905 [Mucor lusitanicus CBS 277.49]OAD08249.1 hypothetical protein MUCCIDRAFT_105207 [Mucor lusitanicus CBS 277.49]